MITVTVNTLEELDALPDGSVIHSADRWEGPKAWIKRDGLWFATGSSESVVPEGLGARVLHVPAGEGSAA